MKILFLSPRSIAVVQPHQRVHQKLTEFWSTMASPSTPQLFFSKYFYSSHHLFDFQFVCKWYFWGVRLCLSFFMIQVLMLFVFVLWCCSQRPKRSELSEWQLSTRKKFSDKVRKSFLPQKKRVNRFRDKKVCINCFCNKTSVLESFLQQKSVRWLYLRQKIVHK